MDTKFLRLPAVLKRYGIARTTLYDLVAKSEFPKPIHVGRSALWSLEELSTFDQERLAARDEIERTRPKCNKMKPGALPGHNEVTIEGFTRGNEETHRL